MRFHILADWLRWQETLHPSDIELGLARVSRVWAKLGPEKLPFPVISIAGTNGKGSCAAMLEAVYTAAGYVTACYTSPHLLRYNERVRIRSRAVSDEMLCEAFERVESARDGESLTYFEFGTLAAMDLFVRMDPDVAILEVGLGGRLDAVNVFDADLALITSIGLDHMAWLGETLEEIALEKAGILRAGRSAVIGHRDPLPCLLEYGERIGSHMHCLGQDFDYDLMGADWRWHGPGFPPLTLAPPALRGKVQYDNAAAALMCVSCLGHRLPVSLGSLRQGLQRTRISGRFQVLPGEPTWILDVAHNGPAAAVLAENIESVRCLGKRHAIIGMLRDKEPAAVVGHLLEWVDVWHVGTAGDPRAMPSEELSAVLRAIDSRASINTYAKIEEAVAGAVSAVTLGDCILVFGSFTTVEAALRQMQVPTVV